MIFKKFSFNLNQAEPSSSIRTKVTITNVNRIQMLIYKKNGSAFLFVFGTNFNESLQIFIWPSLADFFFFLIHDVQNYIHILQGDFSSS